jgi:hypothetical protein
MGGWVGAAAQVLELEVCSGSEEGFVKKEY